MDTWLRDVRYALRTMLRGPGFAAVTVLTLAFGIGANTAVFSVVNAVLIRPLGYANEDRLVSVHEAFPERDLDRFPFSALDFEDLRQYQQSFDSVAAYRNVPFELSDGSTPERIEGAKVSAELFAALGVEATLGRTFSTAEDRPSVNVAILSSGLWERRYAADPSIVGESIHIDRQPYTVIGIMPATFEFPPRGARFNGRPAEVWVPLAFTKRERAERASMHSNSVIARLKNGVSLESARAELDVLAKRITENYPALLRNAGFAPRLLAQPLREDITGRFEVPLLMLLSAVGFVLLVACANVANLILSRAIGRKQEFAVRTALGARQGHLVRLRLCEASLLSLAGGLSGIAIGYWAIALAPSVLARDIPGFLNIAIDLRVLAFTGAICAATTLVFALVPLATSYLRGPEALHEDTSRTSASFRKLRMQHGLVVLTVALAVMLMTGAGLLLRSFTRLLSTDIGFRPTRVVAASMTLPRTFYTSASAVRTFHESLYERLAAVPGLRSAALATDLPLTTYEIRAFTPEGAILPDGAQPTANLTWVHGPYFETLGMTLRHGRFFIADEHVQDRGVVVVNEKLADLIWPGQPPVGKRLKWGIASSLWPWLTIVGVVANVADGPIGAPPAPHAYEPFRQFPDLFLDGAANQFGRDVKAAVLVDSDPRPAAASLRTAIASLDPDLAIESVAPIDQQVDDAVAPRRFSTLLAGAFAAVASFLATVGLYGLLAFMIGERKKEIAVRLAVGADRSAIVRMVVGHGTRLVLIGLIVGLAGSLGVARLLESLLYQTNRHDLVTFVAVPAVLAAAALVAGVLPAWRAARLDPAATLRQG